MTAPAVAGAAAVRLAAVLLLALAAVLLHDRGLLRHRGGLRDSVLFRRWRTWAVATPLFLAAVASAPGAAVLLAALSAQGCREYASLAGLPRSQGRALAWLGAGSILVAALAPQAWLALPPLVLLAATIVPVIRQEVGSSRRRLADAAFGFAYVPLLLGYALLLRGHPGAGPGVFLAVGVAVATSDVGAFVAGRVGGGRRLAPRLSPGKTVAGAVGNLAGAVAGVALCAFALPAEVGGLRLALLPVVVAVGAVWGDLLESLLKREAGVKDAGSWLPGFGGLLDRIDSFLVSAPLAYFLVVSGRPLVAR